jgi:hypothetical protein
MMRNDNNRMMAWTKFGVGNRPLHPYPAGGSFYRDRGCAPGQSVTHLAARSPEVEYLKLVHQHRESEVHNSQFSYEFWPRPQPVADNPGVV